MRKWKVFDGYQPPSAKSETSAADRWILRAVVLATLLVIAAFGKEYYFGTVAKPLIALEFQDWKVLLESKHGSCSPQRIQAGRCRFDEIFSDILSSPLTRADKDYRSTLDRQPPDKYWVGTSLEPARFANIGDDPLVLVIGFYLGSYEVWIDGELAGRGDFVNFTLPQTFTVPASKLRSSGLKIAVRILPDKAWGSPDQSLAWKAGGFFTQATIDLRFRWFNFQNDTRNSVPFALFLLFSLVFWSAFGTKSSSYDYAVAAQLSLVLALLAFTGSDLSTRVLSTPAYYRLLNTLMALEAFFIYRLAVGILRSERKIPTRIALGLLYSSVAGLFYIPFQWQQVSAEIFNAYLLPTVYAICCSMVVWRLVVVSRSDLRPSRERLQLLGLVALGFGLTALSYFSAGHRSYETSASRYVNLFTLLVIVRFLAQEFHRTSRLIESTPISPYHKGEVLPPSIAGWILFVDLKRSERWFRRGAQLNKGGDLVSAVLSHLWQAVSRAGGQVMQTEGDSLIALFPNDTPEAALASVRDMQDSLDQLRERFSEAFGKFDEKLAFRAALVKGTVRPIWRQVDGVRIPAWIDAEDSSSLLDAARLLEVGRELEKEESGSILTVESSNEELLSAMTSRWIARNSERIDKSGKNWSISSLPVGSVTSPKRAA